MITVQKMAVCKYCGKSFLKDHTLATHICVKKRRAMEIDTQASRFGFRTFQRFYEITTNTKKLKTQQEFIDSQYYIEFAKFGNYLATLKPLFPEQFIEFVIRNGISLKDWSKDYVYDTYINDLIKKEPASSATERTIINIVNWCTENNVEFTNFFISISANEAAYLIKTGRISPWVLYLASTSETLMNSFNEDHAKMIADVIDPGFWMKKFKKADSDVVYIKSILLQSGL